MSCEGLSILERLISLVNCFVMIVFFFLFGVKILLTRKVFGKFSLRFVLIFIRLRLLMFWLSVMMLWVLVEILLWFM